MAGRFLKSRFASILGLIILVVVCSYLVREWRKKYLIDQEIAELKNEIAKTQGQNEEMLSLIKYLQSNEYKERQARSLLNLQKPGEFAVALPNAVDDVNPKIEVQTVDKSSNLIKWWNYFFAR